VLSELGHSLIEAVSAPLALRTSPVVKIATIHAVLVAAMRTIHNPYILVVISPRLRCFTNQALAIWIGVPDFDRAYHLAPHQLPLIGSLYALPVPASRQTLSLSKVRDGDATLQWTIGDISGNAHHAGRNPAPPRAP
jgi:hypothetical protein